MTSARERLLYILYYALLEMREANVDRKQEEVTALLNYIHNIPVRMARIASEAEYASILSSLRDSAQDHGMAQWLERIESHIPR